ncbi:zinc finger and BTB domain-containing protein 24-like isoform X2 [Zerene cesonia]|nr:zinc finger and BTB domain-containing protein 24-like isoform X2 [Zerene cesonia]XP_038221216.1 zinc finger and BTB domain-containing protein 24-like isoform X2 [Zerene cesonia]XP_038221217.1 zinc finger and BTB domain-containing protein 24-like isoform X2 [Zerene cesonia]
MLNTGALSDVTLNANGVSLRAHRLVLAACSQYFAQIFKEVDDTNTVVVIVDCEPADLRQLLTFMYTGEVTAARKRLPSLLKLAHSLQVSGLTDADTNPTDLPTENELIQPTNDIPMDSQSPPMNLEKPITDFTQEKPIEVPHDINKEMHNDILVKNDKLSKLDQIVQNLYSSHNIGNLVTPPTPLIPSLTESAQSRECPKWRGPGSVCSICNKRLSNQYNLRVHMDTHAGRRHACRACDHVSRSRDALRKHVAYRHAHLALRHTP